MTRIRIPSTLALASLVLVACGGGGSSSPQTPAPPLTYSIGGSVSGLQGSNVTLQNNGGDDLSISADGSFTFGTELTSGQGYNVAVLLQPTGPTQTCTVSDGTGTVGSSDIGGISVACVTDSFNVSVTVSGLKGAGLVLQNNGGDDLVVDDDGDHTFLIPVDSGSNYSISIANEPTDPDQACTVSDASGVVGDADVSEIAVNCAALAAIDVFAGGWVSCALLENGRTKCWGHNNFGNLGLGDNIARGTFPGEMGNDLDYVLLGLFAEAVQIDPGPHSCAVLTDGDIKCWGHNVDGQLGLGDTENRGNDVNEMGPLLPRIDLGGPSVISVGTGSGHSCALLENNTVKCWGRNMAGELGQGNTAKIGDEPGEMGSNLDNVSVGNIGALAIDLAVGNNHNCVIRGDNTLACWGLNAHGQLGVGDTETIGDNSTEMGAFLRTVDLGSNRTAVQVVAGGSHTCAILDSGFVKCWGDNSFGQLGQGDVENRGDNADELGDNLPIIPLGSVNLQVDQLAAGTDHTCALLENGGVKCWGSNNRGQLGLGDLRNRGDQVNEMGFNLPFVDLGSGRSAVRIAAGSTHSCALLDSGEIKCWGDNLYGQLGQEDVSIRGDATGEMGDELAAIDLGSE